MRKFIHIFFLIFFLNIGFAAEPELKIAVASNFFGTFKSFISNFEQEYSCKVFLVSDSSSNLYSKFINGAGFDVFITADKNHFFFLSKVNDNVSLSLSFLGKLNIFSKKMFIKKNLLIYMSSYKRVSFANKKLAPYGYAASELIENLRIKYSGFIFGNNINQTFIFIESLSSDIGFVSLSQNILHNTNLKNFYKIPNYLYSEIKQDFILLNNKELCKSIAEYVRRPYIKKIIIDNGYRFLE